MKDRLRAIWKNAMVEYTVASIFPVTFLVFLVLSIAQSCAPKTRTVYTRCTVTPVTADRSLIDCLQGKIEISTKK